MWLELLREAELSQVAQYWLWGSYRTDNVNNGCDNNVNSNNNSNNDNNYNNNNPGLGNLIISPRDQEILGWCPAGDSLSHGERDRL